MSALSIQPTFPIFTDIDGQPLEAGYVWVGTANLDPQTNPISVYWDAALTILAPQPIRTLGGYPANSGTPARLYVDVANSYSIRVMNKNGSVLYSAAEATERFIGYGISYTPDAASLLTATNVQDALDDISDEETGSGVVGFIQSRTNAVPRSSLDKMRDVVSVKDFGAKGDGVTNDTAAFTAAAAVSSVVICPNTQNSYVVNSGVVNASSTFVFSGPPSQLSGTATTAQLRALFTGNGQPYGTPFIDSLRSGRIGIVAGAIRQDATNRTQWNYISDSAHTPVGVSGTFATASGGSITIPYDTTYSRVISFIAGPDESFANRIGMSVGASVGLSSAVINATACFSGAFTLRYDGADWVLASGTGQDINPVVTSYSGGTLKISHGYCRGAGAQLTPFSNNGGVLNPYLPIVKVVGNDFIDIQWIDTTTGSIVTSASPSTRMMAVAQKMNNAGLFLDGTNNATVINGLDIAVGANIWFHGIFEK